MVLADIRKVIIRTVCLDAPEAEDWLLLDFSFLSSDRKEGEKGKSRVVMCLPDMSWLKKEQVLLSFSRFETSRKIRSLSRTARGSLRRVRGLALTFLVTRKQVFFAFLVG